MKWKLFLNHFSSDYFEVGKHFKYNFFQIFQLKLKHDSK